MKGSKGYIDMGTIFDEIFEAAQNFSDEFHRNFEHFGPGMRPGPNGSTGSDGPEGSDRCGPFGPKSPFGGRNPFDENIDYYPNYSYPPMNVYMTGNRSMISEFALAGFNEEDISLSFQGDYMVFSAKIAEDAASDISVENHPADENIRYFKRRLKMKDIEKQKYYVPLDKYAQEQVKAVYKNGILRVTIPPKDEPDQNDGIKIEIIKEGN
jgi:HSP20 family molecular chaperone IbpA